MTNRMKKGITIIGVMALIVMLFTGTALADPVTPNSESKTGSGSRLSQMIERMGPENWGQMVLRMNQIHGPEFTGRMIQRMNQSGACHDGEHAGPGSMMGRGFGGMMGSGFQHHKAGDDGGAQVGPGPRSGMMNRGFSR